MRSVPICLAGAGIALALSAGAASASEWMYGHRAYVTSYRPECRCARRAIVVRERVWRPVRHRIHYRRIYAEPYDYGPYYGYVSGPYYGYVSTRVVYDPWWYPYDDDGYGWWGERRWEHHRWWGERRWEHHRWGHGGYYD